MIAWLVEESSQPSLIPDAAVRLPLNQLLIPGNDGHPREQGQLGLHLRPCCLTINEKVEDGHANRLMILEPDAYLIIAF